MTRLEPDGSITVVANKYQDRRLNRPNDVVVKSDGSIYFTDPGAPDVGLDLDFSGVYRVSPDLGTITLLVRDFIVPNGLAFSPDESVLYIDDSRRRHIRAFGVQPSGVLALASDRIFADLSSDRPGSPDGMKVDVEGNIYCTGPGGVWVIDPNGKHLGTFLTGADQTTNVGWGGEDWKTLFITTYHELACIQLKIPGCACAIGRITSVRGCLKNHFSSWWEKVGMRGTPFYHHHLNPLPSRERKCAHNLLDAFLGQGSDPIRVREDIRRLQSEIMLLRRLPWLLSRTLRSYHE